MTAPISLQTATGVLSGVVLPCGLKTKWTCTVCNSTWSKNKGDDPKHCRDCMKKRTGKPQGAGVVRESPANSVGTRGYKHFGSAGHPKLAAARRNAEASIRSLLSTYPGGPPHYIDVGGGPGGLRRAFEAGYGGMYSNLSPMVSPADVMRRVDLQRYLLQNADGFVKKGWDCCPHLLRDCNCRWGERCVFVFVHSFYYMSGADLARIGLGNEVIIVTHRFVGDSGQIPPESPEFRWRRVVGDTGESIVMEPLAPCGTVYEHPDVTARLDLAVREGIVVSPGRRLYLTEWQSDVIGGGATTIYRGIVDVDHQFAVDSVPPVNTIDIEVSPEIRSRVAALCASKFTAAQSSKDVSDLVGRFVASLVAQFSTLDIETAYKLILAERALAVERNTRLLMDLSANERLHAVDVARGMLNQEGVVPVQGPHFQGKRYGGWGRFVAWLCVMALGMSVSGAAIWHVGVASVSGALALAISLGSVVWIPLGVLFVVAAFAGRYCKRYWRWRQPGLLTSIASRNVEWFGELDIGGFLETNVVLPIRTGAYRLRNVRTGVLCLGYGNPAGVDPKHVVDIPVRPCNRKNQAGAELLGWTTRLASVMSSCRCNMQNALVNRHAVKQPIVKAKFVYAVKLIERLLPEVEVIYRRELAELRWGGTWVQRWPLTKRLAIAVSEAIDRVRASSVQSFVKREVNHAVPTKARLIQGYPNLATQAKFGPEFCALQKAWIRVLNGHTIKLKHGGTITITIASGLQMRDIGDWLTNTLERRPNGCFYERDGKAWDATMQRCHQDLKAQAFSIAGKEFLEFLEAGFKVRGSSKNLRGEDYVSYTLDGTVKSGHNDTSSGNSIINAMITYEVLCRLGVGGDIIVNGDDNLTRLDEIRPADELCALEAEYGIKPEAAVFTDWEKVSFLSAIWAETGDGRHAFIPKPGRLFARCYWTVQKLSNKQRAVWAKDVSECLLRAVDNVPLISDWLKLYGKVTSPVIGTMSHVPGRYYESFGATNPIVDCDAWFKRRYGLTDTEIRECREYLLSLPHEPLLIVHPVLDKIMTVDFAEVTDREYGDAVFGW